MKHAGSYVILCGLLPLAIRAVVLWFDWLWWLHNR